MNPQSMIYYSLFFILFAGGLTIYYYSQVEELRKMYRYYGKLFLNFFVICIILAYAMALFTTDVHIVEIYYVVVPGVFILFSVIHLFDFRNDKRALYSGIFLVTFGGIFFYTTLQIFIFGRDESEVLARVFGPIAIFYVPTMVIVILAYVFFTIKFR